MPKLSPVGVFDSGMGGLTTLQELMRALPGEDFLYYGDNANAPYGVRTEEQIRELTFACVDFLVVKGAKCIVIACNTASSAAVQAVREKYRLPIVAMEPAVRPAATMLKQGKALVMATPATLKQSLYQKRVKECGVVDRMIPLPAPCLVELVEQGILDGAEVDEAVLGYMAPYRDENVDVVVLGCTHFVHERLKARIEAVAKSLWKDALVVDGNEGTAHQLQRILEQNDLQNPRVSGGTVQYFTSGDEAYYLPLIHRLME